AAIAYQALEPIGSREAREDEVLVDVAVDAAALGADARRHDDAITGQERLLVQVQRKRPFLCEILRHRRVCALIDVLLTGHEVLGTRAAGAELPLLELQTRRSGRIGRPELTLENGVQVPVEVTTHADVL